MSRICPQCQNTTIEQVCPHDGFKTVLAKSFEASGDRVDPLIGTTFEGRYVVKSLLGKGGYGAVYRAAQVGVGRDVALKVLKAERTESLKDIARFQTEARAIAALKHPNIITLFDFGQSDDGNLFLAMELAVGEPLSRRLRRLGSLPADQVVKLGVQTLDALAEAHALGIIHRDMKPDNLFIAQEGRRRDVVKVLDFGIAKVNKKMSAAKSTLTATGVTIGSPRYMSPEQCRAEPVVPQSDLYSFGCILYEALCGQPVFRKSGVTDYMLAHIGQPPAPPSLGGKRLEGPLIDFVMRCLAKDPADRPADAEVALAELRACEGTDVIARGGSGPMETETIPPLGQLMAEDVMTGPAPSDSGQRVVPPSADTSPRRLWLLVALAALLLGGGATAAVVLSQSAPPKAPPAEASAAPVNTTAARNGASTTSAIPDAAEEGAASTPDAASGAAQPNAATVPGSKPDASGPAMADALAEVAAAKQADAGSVDSGPVIVAPDAAVEIAAEARAAGQLPDASGAPDVASPPVSLQAVLESAPSGAEVLERRGAVEKVLGITPYTLTWGAREAPPMVVLRLAGHKEQVVSVLPGDAGSRLRVRLNALPAAPATVVTTPPQTEKKSRDDRQKKKTKRKKKKKKRKGFETVDD